MVKVSAVGRLILTHRAQDRSARMWLGRRFSHDTARLGEIGLHRRRIEPTCRPYRVPKSILRRRLLKSEENDLVRWRRRDMDAGADIGREKVLGHTIAIQCQRNDVAGDADQPFVEGETIPTGGCLRQGRVSPS